MESKFNVFVEIEDEILAENIMDILKIALKMIWNFYNGCRECTNTSILD
jgi:hypothetical protein